MQSIYDRVLEVAGPILLVGLYMTWPLHPLLIKRSSIEPLSCIVTREFFSIHLRDWIIRNLPPRVRSFDQ